MVKVARLTNSADYFDMQGSEELADLPRQVEFLMYLLAGQVAEEMLTGRANPGGAERDDDEIRVFALHIGGGEEGGFALTKWIRLRVEQLLAQPLT